MVYGTYVHMGGYLGMHWWLPGIMCMQWLVGILVEFVGPLVVYGKRKLSWLSCSGCCGLYCAYVPLNCLIHCLCTLNKSVSTSLSVVYDLR